jgi:hypothetical protein
VRLSSGERTVADGNTIVIAAAAGYDGATDGTGVEMMVGSFGAPRSAVEILSLSGGIASGTDGGDAALIGSASGSCVRPFEDTTSSSKRSQ